MRVDEARHARGQDRAARARSRQSAGPRASRCVSSSRAGPLARIADPLPRGQKAREVAAVDRGDLVAQLRQAAPLDPAQHLGVAPAHPAARPDAARPADRRAGRHELAQHRLDRTGGHRPAPRERRRRPSGPWVRARARPAPRARARPARAARSAAPRAAPRPARRGRPRRPRSRPQSARDPTPIHTARRVATSASSHAVAGPVAACGDLVGIELADPAQHVVELVGDRARGGLRRCPAARARPRRSPPDRAARAAPPGRAARAAACDRARAPGASPLGQRRVALVQVRRDVGEHQRARERRRRGGLDVVDPHLARPDPAQQLDAAPAGRTRPAGTRGRSR